MPVLDWIFARLIEEGEDRILGVRGTRTGGVGRTRAATGHGSLYHPGLTSAVNCFVRMVRREQARVNLGKMSLMLFNTGKQNDQLSGPNSG